MNTYNRFHFRRWLAGMGEFALGCLLAALVLGGLAFATWLAQLTVLAGN